VLLEFPRRTGEPRCDAECREIELRKSASPFPFSYRRYAAPPSGWRSF
jgi:hypothetical protein